jgi:hypothetical protein
VSVPLSIKVIASGQTMLLAYLPTSLFPLAGYGVKYKYINGLRCKENEDSAVAPDNSHMVHFDEWW